MNIVEFVLLVSAGIIVLAGGIDVAQQIWSEKRADRVAHCEKVREAEATLYTAVYKKFGHRMTPQTNVVELKVTEAPKKPASGRHRLTAA